MIGMMRPFYQAHWDISKDIKHVWLLICTYYIAWIFQWILSGEGRGKWWDRQYRVWIPQCAAPLDVTVTYARDSFVDSPSVLRPGWHMQETAFVDSQGGLLSSRGGAQTHWHRQIGTSLTKSRCSTRDNHQQRWKRERFIPLKDSFINTVPPTRAWHGHFEGH